MRRIWALCLLALPFPALAHVFDTMAPGTWYEVPASSLGGSGVQVNPFPPHGTAPQAEQIMKAWNGGAFDSSRNQLLIWGGGHGDYAGSEVYSFDVDTLAWTRLTDPYGWEETPQYTSEDGIYHNEANVIEYPGWATGGNWTQDDTNANAWWIDATGLPLTRVFGQRSVWSKSRELVFVGGVAAVIEETCYVDTGNNRLYVYATENPSTYYYTWNGHLGLYYSTSPYCRIKAFGDGVTPVPPHSYGSLVYDSAQDRFYVMGGAAIYKRTAILNNNTAYYLDLDTNAWAKDDGQDIPAFFGQAAVYDPTSGHIFSIGAQNGSLLQDNVCQYSASMGNYKCLFMMEYDPVAGTSTRRWEEAWNPTIYQSATIDVAHNAFVQVSKQFGTFSAFLWDLDTVGPITRVRLTQVGDVPPSEDTWANPGYVYDPIGEQVVLWNGGTDVWTGILNGALTTITWTKHTGQNQGEVPDSEPGLAVATGGTYGRFRYVPAYDVFMVVNSVDENVYAYRPERRSTRPSQPAPVRIVQP